MALDLASQLWIQISLKKSREWNKNVHFVLVGMEKDIDGCLGRRLEGVGAGGEE